MLNTNEDIVQKNIKLKRKIYMSFVFLCKENDKSTIKLNVKESLKN